MSEFLVYWTKDDIDREVKAIAKRLAQRSTTEGLPSIFGPISRGIGSLSVKPHILISSAPTKVVSLAAGRPLHYQCLLSARSTRGSLDGHSGGLTGIARIALSHGGNYGRVARDVLGV